MPYLSARKGLKAPMSLILWAGSVDKDKLARACVGVGRLALRRFFAAFTAVGGAAWISGDDKTAS